MNAVFWGVVVSGSGCRPCKFPQGRNYSGCPVGWEEAVQNTCRGAEMMGHPDDICSVSQRPRRTPAFAALRLVRWVSQACCSWCGQILLTCLMGRRRSGLRFVVCSGATWPGRCVCILRWTGLKWSSTCFFQSFRIGSVDRSSIGQRVKARGHQQCKRIVGKGCA